MIHDVVLYLFVLAFLFAIWQMMVPSLRCSYCGRIGGHKDDCPRWML